MEGARQQVLGRKREEVLEVYVTNLMAKMEKTARSNATRKPSSGSASKRNRKAANCAVSPIGAVGYSRPRFFEPKFSRHPADYLYGLSLKSLHPRFLEMFTKRSSGILLHPSSLPSRGGIGDFGPAAYEFIHWLAEGKQTLWQILPLGPPGIGNSPYSSTSAFAGNTLLISLERLADRGLLDRAALNGLPDGSGNRVDFEAVRAAKLPLLREAGGRFLRSSYGRARERYDRFCRDNGWWLDDFVLFDFLRDRHNGASWNTWPTEISHRNDDTLHFLREQNQEELAVAKFLQFAFFEQWGALQQYCKQFNIQIVGDVAIFVSYDSADVWTHPDIFRLRDLEPEVVAGVPPDAFSRTGQRWGNPLYDWNKLRERNYDWWVQRMRWAHTLCDILRIDHFRGFESYWEIPAHEPTAINGRWAKGPADDFFQVLNRELGALPFIAEDLGMITPEVHALRERLQIPGHARTPVCFWRPRSAHVPAASLRAEHGCLHRHA